MFKNLGYNTKTNEISFKIAKIQMADKKIDGVYEKFYYFFRD